jgi:hypothetical protein
MAEQRYSILLLFVISACSQAAPDTKITFDNELSNCIKIEQAEVIYKDGLPMLKASYQQLQSTSECGCNSKISAYSSLLEMDGYNSQLMTGKFVFSKDKLLNVPIATSKQMIGDFSVLVKFSCAIPD